MALADEFRELYDREVYKGGVTASGAASQINNPRGLARYLSSQISNPLYPQPSAIVSGIVQYHYPSGPTGSVIDANPPRAIRAGAIRELGIYKVQSLIDAGLIERLPSARGDFWKLGESAITVLGSTSGSVILP